MMKTFETFKNFDIDPYNEEQWEDEDLRSFQIGDKVECIDNENSNLELGKIYTVKWVVEPNMVMKGFLYLEDSPRPDFPHKMKRFKKVE